MRLADDKQLSKRTSVARQRNKTRNSTKDKNELNIIIGSLGSTLITTVTELIPEIGIQSWFNELMRF